MRFSPEYIACVLNENFEDAKALFLSPLMRIHYAHLVMLTERAIIPAAEAGTARNMNTVARLAELAREMS